MTDEQIEAYVRREVENYAERMNEEYGIDTLAAVLRQLDAARGVLGDLLQEKISGLKVYSVTFGVVVSQRTFPVAPLLMSHGPSSGTAEVLPQIWTSPQAAMESVDQRIGKQEWVEHDSHGRCWASGRYVISEHEIG